MRRQKVHYAPSIRKSSLATVHRSLKAKMHRHVCTNDECRLTYEDACYTPELNARCRPCKGLRRTWAYPDGVTALDPRPCCHDNTALITNPDDHLRYDLAGPGPWFQCLTCKRTHGHPCVDPDLLARPFNYPKGKS